MELAGLADRGGWEDEGRERGNVCGDARLEDLAGGGVEVDGAGPDFVLWDGGGGYGRCAAWDWAGGCEEGGGECQDGGDDGCGELHFDVWLGGLYIIDFMIYWID